MREVRGRTRRNKDNVLCTPRDPLEALPTGLNVRGEKYECAELNIKEPKKYVHEREG